MRKFYIAIAAFALLLSSGALAQAQNDSDIRVIRGTVESVRNLCEVDGSCSFVVRTPDGPVNVVWNLGDVIPSISLRCPISDAVSKAGGKVKVGQTVEVHIPASSANNALCGDKAAIIPIQ